MRRRTCTTPHALTNGCLCTPSPSLTRTLLLSPEETLLSLTDMKGKFGFCYKTPHPLSFDGSERFVRKHFNPLYGFSCRLDRVCYLCHLMFLSLRKATEQNSHGLLSCCYILLYPVAYPLWITRGDILVEATNTLSAPFFPSKSYCRSRRKSVFLNL